MRKNKDTITLLAGLLAAACSPQDSFDAYVEGAAVGEDMLYGAGEELGTPPGYEPADDDDPSPLDAVTNPDQEDDGPGGRITWMGSEDGDLIIHATIGAQVLPHYPAADHYAIRMVEESGEIIVAIESAQQVTLDWFLSRPAVEGEGVAVYAPYPVLPDLEICAFWPCKAIEPWPSGDDGVDEFGFAMVGSTMQIRGQISHLWVALDVYEDGDVVQLSNGPLGEQDQIKLAAIGVVLDDVAALGVEVEAVHSCWKCAYTRIGIVIEANMCIHNPAACKHAYDGAKAWNDECGEGCD